MWTISRIRNFYFASICILCVGATAQTSESKAPSTEPPDITLSVAKASNLPGSAESDRIEVILANNTQDFLVRRFIGNRNAIDIHVHEANGTVPAETPFGAKRHISSKSLPQAKMYARQRAHALIVPPGKTVSLVYDVGKEFSFGAHLCTQCLSPGRGFGRIIL